ncbi:MAG: autotransporter domain-containing protein [Paracoccaceae bacterium]
MTLSSTTAAQPSFTAPTLGANDAAVTLTFQLVVTDNHGNASTADTVTVTVNAPALNVAEIEDAFRDVTAAFISRRAERIVSSEPLAYRFDVRRLAGGLRQVSLGANDQGGTLSFALSSKSGDDRLYFWSEGTATYYNDAVGALAKRDGEFSIIYMGVDYLVADKLAIGVMAEVDRATETIPGYSEVSGTGWMIGPYATGEISPGVYASLRAAWGKSDNSAFVDALGTGAGFAGDFDTERMLVLGSVRGEMDLGDMRMFPVAELAYYRETQDDYSVSDGTSLVNVSGADFELGRFSVASMFEWSMPNVLDMPVAFARPQLNWNFFESGFDDDFETFSGALEFGIKTDSSSSWQGEVSLRLDGLGTDDFEGVSARVYLSKEF